MKVAIKPDSAEIVSYMPETKDVDQLIIVPRAQPLEQVLDHNNKYVKRFTWEDELIPEPLRRDPLQLYSDHLDNAWIRKNIAQLLRVQIQKNNPPPTSKKDSNSSSGDYPKRL